MPFNFSGQLKSNVAKNGVVSDGETFTVDDGYGFAVTSVMSQNTAFAANPTRSGVGVWSVPMKDSATKIIDLHVATLLPSGTYLGTQLQPVSRTANGALVLNWTFNVAGTPTDLPPTAGPGFGSGFAVLAGSGITNTGSTVINGDMGTYPTPATTGFPPGVVNGHNHAADSVSQAAQTVLTAQYTAAQALPGAVTIPTDLNGQVLTPGVYSSLAGTFSNSGTLTLSGAGSYTFQAASTLITSTSSTVLLTNGAKASQVVWAVGSSATLGTTSHLEGSILALTSITANTGATVTGQLLARNGAVTLAGNTVTVPAATPGTAAGPQFQVFVEYSEASY